MLPDVDEAGYDEWHNQLFQEDADRKIHGLALTQQVNERAADLSRIGTWASTPPADMNMPPDVAQQATAPGPPPVDMNMPPDVVEQATAPGPGPAPMPSPAVASPSPTAAAAAEPTPSSAALSLPATTAQPSPAPATAPTSSDWQSQVFGQALGAVDRTGGDVQAFAERFSQGLSGATDAKSVFGQALGAAAASGADVQAFADTFQPPEPPRPEPPSAPSSTGTLERGGPLQDYARQAALKAGIDPNIFVRQIQQESGFNPNARSPAGATGVAQFMPATAQGMGVDPNDPYQSLEGAARLMANNLQQYGGDYSKALAAYNAGPGNVAKYGGVPPFEETQRYVSTILGGRTPTTTEGLERAGAAVGGAAGVGGRTFPLIGFTPGENGNNDPHSTYHLPGGSDLMAPRGTPVVAMGNGKVVDVTTEPGNAPGSTVGGNTVLIRGDDGLEYYYAHLDQAPMVKPGQRVQVGQPLGAVGNTGNAFKGGQGETHLHIGIGHGISNGQGAAGGLGQDFDAQGLLAQLLSTSGKTPVVSPHEVKSDNQLLANDPVSLLTQSKQEMVNKLQEGIIGPLRDALSLESVPESRAPIQADTGQAKAAVGEPSPLDRLGSLLGVRVGSEAAQPANAPGAGYDPSSMRAQTEPPQAGVPLRQDVRDIAQEAQPSLLGTIGSAFQEPPEIAATRAHAASDPGFRRQQLAEAQQQGIAGDQFPLVANLAGEADTRVGEAFADTTIEQAKAQGWQPSPDQERITRAVLSQVTPINILGATATGGGVGIAGGGAAARYLAESALGLGLNMAGTTAAGELAQNAGLPAPLQFGAGFVGGALAQLTGHSALAATSRAVNFLESPAGQEALRAKQRAQFSLDPEGAQQAEAAAAAYAASGPVTGEGMLEGVLARLDRYPEETAAPVRQAATELRKQAPASDVARTIQKWIEQNPPGSPGATLTAAEEQQVEALVQSRSARARQMGMSDEDLRQRVTEDVRRARGPVAGAVPPEQMPLFGGEVQPRMEAPGAGTFEVPTTAARTPEEAEAIRQALMRSYLEGGGAYPGGPSTEVSPGRLAAEDIPRAGFGDQPTQAELGLQVPGELNAPGAGPFEAPATAARTPEEAEATRRALMRAWLEDPTALAHPGAESTAARAARISAEAGGDTATARDLSRRVTYDDLGNLRLEQAEIPGVGSPRASKADRLQNFMTSNMLIGPRSLFNNIASQTEEVTRAPLIRALAGYPGEAWTGVRMLAAASGDALSGARDVWATGRGSDVIESATHAPIDWFAPGLRANAGLDEFYRTIGNAQARGMESARIVSENPDIPRTQALSENQGQINMAGQRGGATSVFGDGPNEGLGAQISGLRRRLTNDPNPLKQVAGWGLYTLVPFSRIPEAIWNKGLKRAPVVNEAWGSKKMVDGWREGLKTGDWRNYRMAAAETLLDSTINLAILDQASRGNVTGADDPEHPWSIRLPGDVWLDYRNLGPTATRLGIIASIVEADQEKANKLKPNVLLDIANKTGALAEKTWFLDSTVGVLDLIKNGNLGSAASKELVQLGDRLTPVGSLANYIEQSTDPVMRNPSTELPQALWERQQSRIPGAAGQLPPKISTTTGEAQQRPQQGWLAALAGAAVDPDDPVRHELARLARPSETTGFKLTPPPIDTTKMDIGGSEVPLETPQERQLYLSERGKFVAEQGKFMDTPEYKAWDDDTKARYWQRVLDASAGAARAKVVESWGGTDSPTFQDKIARGHRVVGRLEPLTPEPAPTPASIRRK